MYFLRFAAAGGAVACALALGACGSGRTIPQTAAPGGTHGAATTGAARLIVQVPAATAALSSTARRARYVSPATQSLDAVTDPGTPGEQTFEIDLTTANPNCAPAGPVAPLTCTITLPLAAGPHTANFFTYDRPGGGRGNGHLLSQNESVPFTVAANGPTAVGVTLDGVPRSIVVAPRQSNGHVFPVDGGFGIAGSQPQKFFVSVLDAAGYAIVGPGTPIPSIAISNPDAIALTNNPANPLQFSLRTKHVSVEAQLTVTATPPAESGAMPVSTTVPITTLEELWTTASVSASLSEVAGFAILPGPSLAAIPSDTITFTTPEFVPSGIAVDAAGTLWVSDNSDNAINAIRAYTPGVTLPLDFETIFFAPVNGIHQLPTGLAFDGNGALWVAPFRGAGVLAFTPGTATPIDADTIPITNSTTLAFDARGNLWVSNQRKVHAYAPGTKTPIVADTIGGGNSVATFGNIDGLAFDINGQLWISDQIKNTISAFVPGTSTPVAGLTITAGVQGPGGIAVDSHDTLWAANGGTGSLNGYIPGTDRVRVSYDLGGFFPSYVAIAP